MQCLVQIQFNPLNKIVRSDNEVEYTVASNHSLGTHRTAGVGIPQLNKVAKGKNLHLLELNRALMLSMNVSKSVGS